jgi:hypothetical protein
LDDRKAARVDQIVIVAFPLKDGIEPGEDFDTNCDYRIVGDVKNRESFIIGISKTEMAQPYFD